MSKDRESLVYELRKKSPLCFLIDDDFCGGSDIEGNDLSTYMEKLSVKIK